MTRRLKHAKTALQNTPSVAYSDWNAYFVDEDGTVIDLDDVYLGGKTNGIHVESGGELTLLGTATRWDDFMVAINATKLGGTKDPGFSKFRDNGAGSQGVFTYWFAPSSEEEVYFSVQMPHSWAGTAIYPHVHWTASTASDGSPADQKVVWGMEYSWTDISAAFPANSSIVTGSAHTPADADIVAGKHYLTPLTAITPVATQDGISSMLICRLYRDATALADNFEQDAGLLQFDIHYEMDTMGSKTEFAK